MVLAHEQKQEPQARQWLARYEQYALDQKDSEQQTRARELLAELEQRTTGIVRECGRPALFSVHFRFASNFKELKHEENISLTRYLVEQQRVDGLIPGQLRLLLEVVARACKRISFAVNKGELGDVMGTAGSENVQGEVQKKLDIIANETLIEANEWAATWQPWLRKKWKASMWCPTAIPKASTC